MTTTRSLVADARFLLPAPVDAAASDEQLVLDGIPDGRALAAGGYAVARYLSLPSVAEPKLLVPIARGAVAPYALANWTFPRTRLRRARNRAARALLAHGVRPPLAPTVTVAARRPGPPYLIGAARALGVPDGVGFFVRSGGLDELSRSTFFLFERGAATPAWLLKFARVPGYAEPFARDERGLGLVAAAPASVGRHAPRLLGRFEVDGLHASVETAAIGKPLADQLRARAGRAERLALVDAVAEWIVELGRATRRDDRFEQVRADLQTLDPELAASLPVVPTVLQHNDLGCWNVIGDADSFVAVDWESAREAGLPLWDLWYFLLDALAAVDAVTREQREAHFAALFRGELESSSVLFAWTRRAVDALEIPVDAVGRIATLCWLHHAGSHVAREQARRRHGAPTTPPNPFPFAAPWLADPGLGPTWSSWRA
jgi:hypothetical protein